MQHLEQMSRLHTKFQDSRLWWTLVICCKYAVICCKIAFFEPSSCNNCSIDLKFCIYNPEQVFRLHKKFQDSRLWQTMVLCCKYAVKCRKIAFFGASSYKNCSIDLKFCKNSPEQVFCLRAKFQDSKLQRTLILYCWYAVKCCKIAFLEASSGKNCSIDLKFCIYYLE